LRNSVITSTTYHDPIIPFPDRPDHWVSSSAQELDKNFKSLEKAMDDKELDVREINGDGSSAQVNTLEVINNGTGS
jgi:hypothetical protein